MAELATIARPYADALFKAIGSDDAVTLSKQVDALSAIAGHAEVRQFADNPKVQAKQVYDLVTGVAKVQLSPKVANLLSTVIENGRISALPEIAAQFRAQVNARSGVSDAKIYSAFALDAAQFSSTVTTLEKRFGRKLDASVVVDPSLIGGIRVVVGDEVLDSSIKARLEQMKVALTS